jgi:multicomponent Na+:H+ antiporter subunit E
MIVFLWNIFLAAIWGMATGIFTVTNLVVGFALGYLILRFSQRFLGPSTYFSKVRLVLLFVARYIWEMFLANFRVAYDVLIPGAWSEPTTTKGIGPLSQAKFRSGVPNGSNIVRAPLSEGAYICPGVIGIPLDVRTDVEISLLANLITLTPGSVSLDLSADRKVLFIHAMYIDNQDIEEGLERRVLELLR